MTMAATSEMSALEAYVQASTGALHGIASRSDPAQIAAEVLRLNDAVRAATDHRMPSTEPPGAYLQVLLWLADDFMPGGTPA
jgi:aspartyl-tRNA(Asn)/glutamyl-tRNA(Gln) amidotransferase subunit A